MDRLTSRTFSLCLLLLVFTGSEGQGSQCQNGWFGDKCQNKCLCLNDKVCDKVTGECPGDCERLWFGPQCQYRIAAYSTSSPLTDGSESTCLVGTGLSQDFQMFHEVRFTWMSFVTNGAGLFDRVNITFLSRFEGKVTPKSSLTKFFLSDTVLYLYGELEDRFKTIRLEFDSPETRQSFCSMEVSSGRNVAIKQNASQSSTYLDGGAENAVDWTDSCTSTNYEDSPYWTLHLSQPVTVNYYFIRGRTDISERCKLRYFRLESYLNSTKVFQYDKIDASVSYFSRHFPLTTSPITSVKLTISKFFWPNNQVQCNDYRLSLCYISILGDVVCPPGKWGRDCEKDCKNCHDSCFVSTGMCTSGCKAGFYGAQCQEECPDGQWGVDCLNRCDNCLNGKCNKTFGECLSGCYRGYKMPYCVQECDAGFHGDNCILSCPANCKDNICNNVDGPCVECVTGYQGPLCNQECNSTFYGANCSTPCSDMCIDQLCHHITGVCHNCPDGKQTSMDCSQDCSPGFYGPSCANLCSEHCGGDGFCNHIDGSCLDVCKPGYKSDNCDLQCPDGQWGVDCLNRCDNCLNGNCNKISGECLSRCSWGYKMPFCVEECDAGFHGYNCMLSCPASCQDNICNNVDGTCVECVTGYQGPVCNQDPDELNLVIIVVPVVVGLVVVAALITGICLWRRRKNQQRGEGTYVNDGEIKGSHVENENGVDLELENQDPVDDNYEMIGINLNEDNQGSNDNVNMNPYVNFPTQVVSGCDRISQPVNEETSDTNVYETM